VLAILGYAAYRLVRHYAFPTTAPPTVPATYGCSGRPNRAALPARPIIAFGDSITWGQGASRNCLPLDNSRLLPVRAHLGAPDDTSYPADLLRVLREPVLNYGVRGERTDQGLSRLRRLVRMVHPSLVAVMEGTNDMLQRRAVAAAVGNLRAMVAAVRHVGARALLLTPPPLYGPAGYSADSSARLARLAQALGHLGRRPGVPVVEVWDAFVRRGGDAALMRHGNGADDHIHPNDAGYRLIAALVARSMRKG
jgi:lysophospholipase L1-like esterase